MRSASKTLALLMLLSGMVKADESARGHPNVLLIMTDNQAASLLGAYGNRDVLTPNIDRLAEQGVLFKNAYATTGVCSPSRAVLMTGLIPSRTGVHNGLPSRFDVPGYSSIAEFQNLPQSLSDAGYQTALIGKYHLGAHESAQPGFDYWVTFRGGHTTSFTNVEVFDNGRTYDVADTGQHLTDFWTRRAIDFLKSRQPEQPFFLWLSYNGPYILPPTVNQPPVSSHAEYYLANPPAMPQHPVHPYMRAAAKNITGRADDPALVGGSYPWAAIDALNNKTAMVNIAAETTLIDDNVGKLVATLNDLGLQDNTLVVFLSDQGSAYGQNGLWGNSSWGYPAQAYNANMQIPLIFRQPNTISSGLRRTEMINQFDIFPTLLEYLGLGEQKLQNSPGVSFAPLLTDTPLTSWQDEVFFEYIDTRVIQTRRWKYTGRLLTSPNELYDMANDPGETHNLIDSDAHQGIVAQLSGRMETFFSTYADPQFDPWQGGSAKALMYYPNDPRNGLFRNRFPNARPPFVETRPSFSNKFRQARSGRRNLESDQ